MPPTITNVSVSPEPSTEGNVDTVTATFTDPGTADVHTCTINWGDGNTTSGTVSAGSCTGTHTYADNGSYTVSVTIDDGDGGTDTDSTLHVVANAPPVITAVTVTPEPSLEGGLVNLSAPFTDAGTADTHACTINWGDGSPVQPGTISAGACTGSHTYADEGSFTVTVVVTDDDTGADTDTTIHVVNNAPPVVGAVTVAPSPSNEGQSVTASASFTDAGVNDTHTCTVDYGDGSPVVAGTVASGTCTGPVHVYADEGTGSYTVDHLRHRQRRRLGHNSTSHTVLNVAPTVNAVTVIPEPSSRGRLGHGERDVLRSGHSGHAHVHGRLRRRHGRAGGHGRRQPLHGTPSHLRGRRHLHGHGHCHRQRRRAGQQHGEPRR